MDWAELGKTVFMTVYTIMLIVVSAYGFHRYVLVFLYYRHKSKVPKAPRQYADGELPRVTVQLPMYNEKLVAKRIIERTCRLDYPKNLLQIQVLDDSTDETRDIAAQAVREAAAKGFDIQYIHRDNREGYKAGALSNGLKTATGEFVSIFDADFIPKEDFLRRSIHHFTDPKVCVVQTRWEHINRKDSALTRSQAIFLDGHFVIEHVARNRSQRFMSFNGTAGTWRRAAIDDAGGWQHDTLTEDLDLSYRAQLRGWKFVFLPELTAPAELPPEMNAFKAQQFRWTKGGAQTAMKLMPKILLSKAPLKVKIEAFFHLTSFSMHIYMLLLVLMMFPAMLLRTSPLDHGTLWRTVFDMSVFTLATLSATVFYAASQFELNGDWRSAIKYMPMMMALGVGLCISNTKAIIEALLGKKSEFVRTPKYGDSLASAGVAGPLSTAGGARRRRKLVPYIELLMGLYMVACAVYSLWRLNAVMTAPFLLMFAFGFLYVSISSLIAGRATSVARRVVPAVRKA